MGKKVLFAALSLLIVAAAVWVIWSNVTVELHRITVQSAGLPTAFDGAKIAHVSDLHNASFGERIRRCFSCCANRSRISSPSPAT